jgi:hypothetical protein
MGCPCRHNGDSVAHMLACKREATQFNDKVRLSTFSLASRASFQARMLYFMIEWGQAGVL